ncbi:hypothetical protein D3C78_1269000 [compost metagenome]
MPGSHLHDHIPLAQQPAAVIQFEGDLAFQHHAVVDGVGAMEAGGVGLEQLAQPGQPFAQLAGGRLGIEVRRHCRRCGRKGDAHRATATRRRQHRVRRAGGLDGMRGNRPGGGLPDQFDGEAGELAELADAGQRAAAGDDRAAGLIVAGDDALGFHGNDAPWWCRREPPADADGPHCRMG